MLENKMRICLFAFGAYLATIRTAQALADVFSLGDPRYRAIRRPSRTPVQRPRLSSLDSI
jgi:hypothetical protein